MNINNNEKYRGNKNETREYKELSMKTIITRWMKRPSDDIENMENEWFWGFGSSVWFEAHYTLFLFFFFIIL